MFSQIEQAKEANNDAIRCKVASTRAGYALIGTCLIAVAMAVFSDLSGNGAVYLMGISMFFFCLMSNLEMRANSHFLQSKLLLASYMIERNLDKIITLEEILAEDYGCDEEDDGEDDIQMN